jgi:hypothetical protein
LKTTGESQPRKAGFERASRRNPGPGFRAGTTAPRRRVRWPLAAIEIDPSAAASLSGLAE